MKMLPSYSAPTGGQLSGKMLADYRESGVLILEGFVSASRCQELREHTVEIINAFDPAEVKHIFSAMEQTQLGDSYFEESGDKIRFFFEGDAFDEKGALRQSKEDSLNKMGHAMHDLDPVFDRFSRTPELAAVVESLGYQEPVILQSMYIFKPPSPFPTLFRHQLCFVVHCRAKSQQTPSFWPYRLITYNGSRATNRAVGNSKETRQHFRRRRRPDRAKGCRQSAKMRLTEPKSRTLINNSIDCLRPA
jgi:hypothetical protein